MLYELSTFDVAVLLVYLATVVGLGVYFARYTRTPEDFTAAGRSLSGWVLGLSLLGGQLSSITFLAYPATAYRYDWNAAVSLLAIVPATAVVAFWLVPFFRRSQEISAYAHFEQRFGPWARNYCSVGRMMISIVRVGAVLFLISSAIQMLLGWDKYTVVLITGAVITLYTLMGGIKAVIWTDVLQSIVLTVGAVFCLALLLLDMPGGIGQIFETAQLHDKFSVGSFGPSLAEKTFWVVLVFSFFRDIGLGAVAQDHIQRFKAARSTPEAKRAVWLHGLSYAVLAAMFFFIGTALFSYYQTQPDLLPTELHAPEMADRIFPYFIVSALPVGISGLLIAAMFAAAMSSVDSALNAAATLTFADFYKRYINPQADTNKSMWVLRWATLIFGVFGTTVAIGLHYAPKGILETWWGAESAIVGGGMGIFVLAVLSRRATNFSAAIAVTIGSLVGLWIALTPYFPEEWADLRSPFHAFMAVIVTTVTIFLVGVICSGSKYRNTAQS